MTGGAEMTGGAVITGRRARPRVSVIIIFLNEERFLPEAVASVESQAGVDWELLLVDDGSTDGSGPWARARVRARTPGGTRLIRYLRHPGGVNLGMSAARNLGLRHAAGDWVTFLDADDVWLPGKLSTQLDLLDRHPGVEVLASPAQWWWNWDGTNEAGRGDWTQVLGAGRTEVVAPPALVVDYLLDEWRSICDLVVARDAVRRLGGYEPSFTAMFEDQVFHAKVLGRLPALVTSESWYRYRQHAGACTARAHRTGNHHTSRLLFLAWLDRYLVAQSPRHEPAGALAALHRTVQTELRRARHPRLARLARAGRFLTARVGAGHREGRKEPNHKGAGAPRPPGTGPGPGPPAGEDPTPAPGTAQPSAGR
jgi:glycosyltransferase involved in cell wall biosynthesis